MAQQTLQSIAQIETDNRVWITEKSATPNADGYNLTLKNGFPYHAHPIETPDVWKALQAAIKDRSAKIIAYTPPPAPTTEQLIAQMTTDVQSHLNQAAKAAGYDDIKSAVTYADEPAVEKFQNEGRAFRAWRSLVWQKCSEVLTQVQNGDRAIPTKSELLAELPTLVI